MFATPELMRLVMRKKPGVLSDLSADDKISLLGYLLSDSNYSEMAGQCVLIADYTIHKTYSSTTS